MKRDKRVASRGKLGLKKESLRQLAAEDLQQVGGGYELPAYLRTCMGTWYQYYGGG
jgi:hypothetical protein